MTGVLTLSSDPDSRFPDPSSPGPAVPGAQAALPHTPSLPLGLATNNPGGPRSTAAARAPPARPRLRHRPGSCERGEAALLGASGWGGPSPGRYPFKPRRDGRCQRQPRLARDVAARQAGARSRGASGEGGEAVARRVPSPPTERSNPGSGEGRAAPSVMRRIPEADAGLFRRPRGPRQGALCERPRRARVESAEPGVRRRGCVLVRVCLCVRECERPGGWERALGILLASQRGEQEVEAGRAGERRALLCTRTRRARAHIHAHALPASLVAAATISEPSPAEREPEPEPEPELSQARECGPGGEPRADCAPGTPPAPTGPEAQLPTGKEGAAVKPRLTPSPAALSRRLPDLRCPAEERLSPLVPREGSHSHVLAALSLWGHTASRPHLQGSGPVQPLDQLPSLLLTPAWAEGTPQASGLSGAQ
ncbi:dapper homolog 3-like [Diceros bicornis minor]|uniref:dapper homolog 3-like n=1 Tax=Diceros bicornis minor TaxID=77932 RepID=UPI0026F144E1|nr:dapper homolog 3-like [Diceros bicornis minor]